MPLIGKSIEERLARPVRLPPPPVVFVGATVSPGTIGTVVGVVFVSGVGVGFSFFGCAVGVGTSPPGTTTLLVGVIITLGTPTVGVITGATVIMGDGVFVGTGVGGTLVGLGVGVGGTLVGLGVGVGGTLVAVGEGVGEGVGVFVGVGEGVGVGVSVGIGVSIAASGLVF